ncbi:DoxX family protein [Synechococcus sp. EJ6-Ellesmere]|uniref:DoxX family protein n=1 Tax=Synechococcus sp. EJ6-Ellesmere TaxID=2823734 RepID=UPI0020CF1D05|nr:DoxX family protein [Synechococcus sp. EJ6-Ellesmere]MCP9825480.1 DoxX family protein [Synechococcus sp. EJ6-Ellesmere]
MSSVLNRYFLKNDVLTNTGLLVLRLAIGTMMIHHGQEKLANPESFAAAYLVPLHMPFPNVMAHLAGLSEILGSWFVILGFLTPIGALALVGTMAVAGYHHILTSGFNIYLLELVVLYLGGSLAILLNGPGRFSIDAGIVADLLASEEVDAPSPSFTDRHYADPAPVMVRAEVSAGPSNAGRH